MGAAGGYNFPPPFARNNTGMPPLHPNVGMQNPSSVNMNPQWEKPT
jgi:hypothetical protein